MASSGNPIRDVLLYRGGVVVPNNDILSPQRLRVVEENGKHQLAVMRVEGDVGAHLRSEHATAVEFVWGWNDARPARFFGYINSTRPGISAGRDKYTDIICVGSTYPLKNQNHRTFVATADEVVKRVCFDHHLAVETEHIPGVRTLYQSGRSDWQFLRDLAEDLGMLLIARGVRVVFMHRMKYLQATSPRSPYLTLGVNLEEIKPVLGEDSQAGGLSRERVATGLTSTGTPFVRKGGHENALFTEYLQDAVHSAGQAENLIEAATLRNQWTHQAKARVISGIERIRVGHAVTVEETGEFTDGTWAVEKVEHLLTTGSYQQNLLIGRDVERDDGFRPLRGTRPALVEQEQSVSFISGRWGSRTAEAVYR